MSEFEDDGGEFQLDDIVELDEDAAPGINEERSRQQAEFHAREAREISALIDAAPAEDRARDPRQAERQKHRELELLCRELAQAFTWLVVKDRPSSDLDLAMDEIREGYDAAPEIALLREIAETQYPLLTTITESRQNGVGLLEETQLSLKHAQRGRPLSDTLSVEEADTLLAGWIADAAALPAPSVLLMPVCQAIEWLVHLRGERDHAGHGRALVDDLEATIYLARNTLDATGYPYRSDEGPAPGY